MAQSFVSVIIPTYKREQVLLETIEHILRLEPSPAEIIVIDQTREHDPRTSAALTDLVENKKILWLRIPYPSIPHAMNAGLQKAQSNIVLFLDDDIIPDDNLIAAHLAAHEKDNCNIVAGQVLQRNEEPLESVDGDREFRFFSSKSRFISELMAGNFSIKRNLALTLGGFDENFVHVAYRFEAEFADRAVASGERIFFEPGASIRHLKVKEGGTRSYGHHLTTIKPSHSVGAYYYLFRSPLVTNRSLKSMARAFRAVTTKHHLYHPWWIIPTLISELLGFVWALALNIRGQRFINLKKDTR